jgi:DNA polymerase III delta prime subunit
VIRGAHAKVRRPALSQLPRPPLRLSGREAQIAEMCAFLREPAAQAPHVILITGPPGIGKTALAIHFAHSIKKQYRNGHYFVSSDPSFQDYALSYETVEPSIDVQQRRRGGRLTSKLTRNRFSRYQHITSKRNLLVIVDGIRDAEKARALLPRNTSSLAIATSLDCIALVPGQLTIHLQPLTDEASFDLLSAMIGQNRLQQDVSAAQEVVDRVSGFPMAIMLAGSSLATRPHWGLVAAVESMKAIRHHDADSHGGVPVSSRLLDMTYALMTKEQRSALRLLGLLNESVFQPWMLAALMGQDVTEEKATRVIASIVDQEIVRRLIGQPIDTPRFSIPGCVSAYARARAKDELSDFQRRGAIVNLNDAKRRAGTPIGEIPGTRRMSRSHMNIPTSLPQPVRELFGRTADMSILRAIYDKHIAQRCSTLATGGELYGPLILLVHGKPGVGKTALVQEFAHQLATEFIDKPLYADLLNGVDTRRLQQILVAFLQTLGDNPSPTLELSLLRQRFQELTAHRHLLIVLDSVRDATDVEYLLPGGAQCIVIVVSRRSLAGRLANESYSLEVLSTDDSWRMLAATYGADIFEQLEYAAETLELCGRLPEAVSSIGEQIAGGSVDLGAMVERLQPLESRLERIGSRIYSSIEWEYEQLTDTERRAFRFLSLIKAPTFVPWVLRPLIRVGMAEADNLVARLERAQLLEIVGPDSESAGDTPFSLPRYRFHPPFKSYASRRLRLEDPTREIAKAQERFDGACLEICARVLAVLEPDVEAMVKAVVEPKWVPATSEWPERIAFSRGDWLQAEYKSVVRAVMEAHRRRHWEICWRLGANLGDSLPDSIEKDEVFLALKKALNAAERRADRVGQIRVTMAQAMVLIALERYGEVFQILVHAETMCQDLRTSGQSSYADGLEADVHRVRAEAWIQLANYANSYKETEEARRLAELARDELEVDRAKALKRELTILIGAQALADDTLLDTSGADIWTAAMSYRDRLRKAEVARSRRKFHEAENHLRRALRQNYGDVRRAASVRYRLARLFLDQWYLELDGARREKLSVQAVGFSASALNSFREMHNSLGIIRARCILSRALCAAGQFDAAQIQLNLAQMELSRSVSQPDEVLRPLRARFLRAQGEYLFGRGSYSEACDRLREACTYFDNLADYRSYVGTLRLLGKAMLANGS